MRQKLKIFFACVLAVACAAALVHSAKASYASYLYHKTKHGLFINSRWAQDPESNLDAVRRNANQGRELYPDYHFLVFAAGRFLEEAKRAAADGDGAAYQKNISQARHFAQHALGLNPYGEETRAIHADILVEEGRAGEAVDFWRTQVIEREFWVGVNQNKFAELLLRSEIPAHLREAVQMLPLVSDPGIRKQIERWRNAIR